MLTLRRRAVIALLAAFPVGWAYVDVGYRLVFVLILQLRGGSSSTACGGSGLSKLVDQFNSCGGYDQRYGYHYGYAVVELLIGTALAAVILYGLARFVAWPVRSMTDDVEQLGPNNLGLRIRQGGSRRDETRRLGEAIDRMLDRVSEGYEAQRRFASNASHELRTPLATQRALIEISLSSALTPEQLELLTRQLLATNERNEQLIDGLLTLAETERGLMANTLVRLDEVVHDAVETLRPMAKTRELELSCVTTPATVRGERPLLERLATNLVQNAIKYNDPGGSVIVNVTQHGTLTVANTGPVVPGELVDGLFEPFRRLSGERLDHGGGVGLGLTIARSVVAAHEGSIVAHANPGGGLVVEVRLHAAG